MQSTEPEKRKPETEAERSARRYREGAWNNAPHGSHSRYAKGKCRCDECRTAEAKRGREKYARRRAAGGQSDPGNVACICRTCGTPFKSGRERSYCNRDCYLAAMGNAPTRSWWVSIGTRLMIYHRDGWRCQICHHPVDMTADPHAPTAPSLDHIVPRARGGADTVDNLRLACRACNVSRGSAIDEYVTT